jgi:hypothetical protein
MHTSPCHAVFCTPVPIPPLLCGNGQHVAELVKQIVEIVLRQVLKLRQDAIGLQAPLQRSANATKHQ